MPRQQLKRRIDALETEISGVDMDTRREMIARLERIVLSLSVGGNVPTTTTGRRSEMLRYEALEDTFDNMPI